MGALAPAAPGFSNRAPELALRGMTALGLWLAAVGASEPHTRISHLAIVLAGLAAGFGFGFTAQRPAPLTVLSEAPGGASRPRWIRGTVRREPSGNAVASRLLLDVEQVRLGAIWVPLRGRIEIRVPGPPPQPNWYRGTDLELFAGLHRDRPAANPGAARHDRLRARGLDLRARLKDYRQVRLRAPPRGAIATLPGRFRDALRTAIVAGQREHALLRALVLGERDGVTDSLWRQLDRSGLLHLLAISGLHVGLLVGAVRVSLRALGAAPYAAAGGCLLVTAALILLVEPRAPVQRAAIMAAAYLLSRAAGSRVSAVDSMATAVIVQLTLAPTDIRQLGFHLTTIATLGLVLSLNVAPLRGPIGGALAAAVTAQVAVAPLVAMTTARVLPLAAIWSLPAVPMLAVALPAGTAAALLRIVGDSSPLTVVATSGHAAATGLAMVADWLLEAFRWSTDASACYSPTWDIPSAAWPLAWAYWSGLAVFMIAPRRGARTFGAAVVALSTTLAARAPQPPVSAVLVAFDVGQGDALLVHGPRGAVMDDAGGYPGLDYDVGHHVLAPQLRRRGIRRLDSLAVSHFHADHAGGAVGLLTEIGAGALWVGSTPGESYLASQVLEAAGRSGTIALAPNGATAAGCAWRVLQPSVRTLLRGNERVENGASLAFDVHCAGRRLVLTGDADLAAERDWTQLGLPASPMPTVLKVSHHGSDTGTSNELLDRLAPRHAVISVGATNPWGLPRAAVLAELRRRGVSVYRTDRDGAVTVTLGPRIRVSGMRWKRGR
jgi:competence protein ComEC